MAQAAMMIGSLAMSAIQTSQKNKALRERQDARNATAARQVAEMKRQKIRQDLIAREEKSDRARELHRQLGELYAAGADGGVTQGALLRASAAAGGVMGLDTARIESNRQETTSGLRSDSVAVLENNQAQQRQTSQEISNNTSEFFGNAAGSAFSFAYASTPSPTIGKPGQYDSFSGPELFRERPSSPSFNARGPSSSLATRFSKFFG